MYFILAEQFDLYQLCFRAWQLWLVGLVFFYYCPGMCGQSCLSPCDPMDCSLPGFPVHGVIPTRILEWIAIFSSTGSSWLRDTTYNACCSCIGRQSLDHWATWEACFTAVKVKVLFAQLYPSLCDPKDSVHGILQARLLEWVASPFSGGCVWPREWTWVSFTAGRLLTVWATREALLYYCTWSPRAVSA